MHYSALDANADEKEQISGKDLPELTTVLPFISRASKLSIKNKEIVFLLNKSSAIEVCGKTISNS